MKSWRSSLEQEIDVLVIGGGQAGLATGYYLRRTGLSFEILDAQPGPGGAWQHTWPSLRLFSPARWCSLPGWIMAGGPDTYPPRNDLLDYMTAYEERYQLPIRRPLTVNNVRRSFDHLLVETDHGVWAARAVVSATGTWSKPYVPDYSSIDRFFGTQIHSAEYNGPETFRGQCVVIIGGANSAAQILAEVSEVAETVWVTRRDPTYLPDNVDGRDLFEWATARYYAAREGRPVPPDVPKGGLGDIVMVEPVRDARERGVLRSVRPFERLSERGAVWPDGHEVRFDAIIWCTGFRPALDHLRGLGVLGANDEIDVEGTRAIREPLLWLVGYGEWTGYASATLIGVGRSARQTALEIGEALR